MTYIQKNLKINRAIIRYNIHHEPFYAEYTEGKSFVDILKDGEKIHKIPLNDFLDEYGQEWSRSEIAKYKYRIIKG